MKEITFLNKNSSKWKFFESRLVEKQNDDIDDIADSFIQITDDLSYANTYYRGSNTVTYLNNLALKTHHIIYRNKKEKRGRIANFWKYELPFAIRNIHSKILYSFLVFAVSFMIGTISTANDDSFVRLILGDSYVDMTLANIEQGDPMAVYKKMNGTEMFLGISWNNILVAFRAFVLGVAFSVFTWYLLFYNGVMLGSFMYFFYQKGLLKTALLTVWIHGTIEISAIIIAGGAGIALGNSLLFPGTYKRLHSFMKSARDGLKTALGLVPFFLTAAFFEGFVTRHNHMPAALSLLIIFSSLLLVVWYFVYYPIKLTKKYNL